MAAPCCIYNYLAEKISARLGPLADLLHRPVQLLQKSVPENLPDLLLRLAPGRNRLFQKLAALRGQAKRLRAAVGIGHHFQPAAGLHPFDVAAEGRDVEMEMLANGDRASHTGLGGGDEDVHL